MNIISFTNVRPYDVYRWTTEYFLSDGYSKNEIQLIHPNARYNKQSPIVICWFIEAFQQNINWLNKENVTVILMDSRKAELKKHYISIADMLKANECIDKAIFTSIISNKYHSSH